MVTNQQSGKALWIVLGVIVLLIIIVASSVIGGYNKAVRLDEGVKNAWAQVEGLLTRRYDLIPNLVETVKGYAGHEKELFENIAQARTQYFNAKGVGDKAQAAGMLDGALSRLLLLQERYPELKANEGFLKLQDQLEGTENRIAVARMRYNDAVRDLNAYSRGFIGRFYCNMAGVTTVEYYDAPKEHEAAPQVQF